MNEQFLRQTTLLLKPGNWQYDLGLVYAWQEQLTPIVVPPGIVVNERIRRRDFVIPFSVRYGASEKFEVFGSLPVGLSHLEVSNITDSDSSMTGGIGDLTAGFMYQLKKHRDYWPELTTSFRVTAPTGDAAINLSGNDAALGNGFWSVATSLNFVSTYDPVVTFGSIGYRHDFKEDFMGVWLTPGERFFYSYGVGFAVNDNITFVSEFFGEYQGNLKIENQTVPGSSGEPMSLRLSMVRRLSSETRLQPFVTFGLNRDAGDVNLGVLFTGDLNKTDPAAKAKN